MKMCEEGAQPRGIRVFDISCDGSFQHVYQIAGWAGVIREKGRLYSLVEGVAPAPNSDWAELMAAVSALQCTPVNCAAFLESDNTFVIRVAKLCRDWARLSDWLARRKYETQRFRPLCEKFFELMQTRLIFVKKISQNKRHHHHAWCDRTSRAGAMAVRKEKCLPWRPVRRRRPAFRFSERPISAPTTKPVNYQSALSFWRAKGDATRLAALLAAWKAASLRT